VDARALGQAVELADGDVEAEEEVQGGLGQPQAQVEELLAVIQAQGFSGPVEDQLLGQAEEEWRMGAP
jgi:hypothetical protein